MIKLIATDLDNTMLNKAGEVTPEVAALLKEVEGRGIHVALATGRSYPSAKGVAARFGGTGYAICYNGSQIRRLADDSALWKRSLPLPVLEGILQYCRENDIYVELYRDDVIIVEEVRMDRHPDPDLKFAEHEEVGDFFSLPLFETPKMLLALDPADVPRHQKILEERYEGEIFCAQSEAHLIEVMPCGVNKGAAMAALQEALGVTRAETMALGDNTNDLHLLSSADLSVAVANAVPAVKEAAAYICEGEREEGFLEALRKFL